MSDDEKWSWWVGNGERYHTECATRDEAVRIAQDYGGATIVEATHGKPLKLSRFFCAELPLEGACESMDEDYGDPDSGMPIAEWTKQQGADLESSIKAAIDAWQERHGITFLPWAFEDTRNEEYIPGGDDD